eukprot:gene22383-biopygen13513
MTGSDEHSTASRIAAALTKLAEIEAEMRRIGFWTDVPEGASEAPPQSFTDAPGFEHWLQVVFLPNARRELAAGRLQPQSSVGLMAMRQYDYHSYVPEAETLCCLLAEFDRINAGS